ncbi:MAG: glycosyltransferase, partial [Sphingobacteriales bacterium]
MLHTMAIRKFTECWVPDFKKKPNLTGRLGHTSRTRLRIQYLGPLSRLKKEKLPVRNDLMVILSGPEPQRTMLEDLLRSELQSFKGNISFVRGVMQSERITEIEGNITYHNFMQSEELQRTFNESKTVLCRSGYTTVMDLCCLGKSAFFIPTPGQYEQEYLAKKILF